eukprot:8391614-Pyramimonas_sp.AAC.1
MSSDYPLDPLWTPSGPPLDPLRVYDIAAGFPRDYLFLFVMLLAHRILRSPIYQYAGMRKAYVDERLSGSSTYALRMPAY